jgi:glycosyltransferase involved in cell wall biosynthesis
MTPMTDNKFSILIPTWNNLSFLKLCIDSIEKNSYFKHQIIIYVNDGSDGTLQWVKEKGLDYLHSPSNVGICFALNSMRTLVKTDYILYMNDDMYVCPDWDKYLWEEIERLPDNKFFLSSTLIQPRPFYCKSVIAPANYGESVEDFREDDLLKEYTSLPHADWMGATWPPNVVHKDIWDLVGGYSVEFSPGMYSDPDFSAKLWLAGVRYFKGISASRVYHFEARSTARIVKNQGSAQFLLKYGITSSTFINHVLHRGEPFDENKLQKIDTADIKRNLLRSKLKRLFYLGKDFMVKKIWEL